MTSRFVALGALALSLAGAAAPASVLAQTPVPQATPVVLPTLPPNKQIDPYVKMGIDLLTGVINHQIQANANSASGRISSFKPFEVRLQTGANSYRTLTLHKGTTIDPEPGRFAIGQSIHATGVAQSDGSLLTDHITIDQ
jgi:hypothetical protein